MRPKKITVGHSRWCLGKGADWGKGWNSGGVERGREVWQLVRRGPWVDPCNLLWRNIRPRLDRGSVYRTEDASRTFPNVANSSERRKRAIFVDRNFNQISEWNQLPVYCTDWIIHFYSWSTLWSTASLPSMNIWQIACPLIAHGTYMHIATTDCWRRRYFSMTDKGTLHKGTTTPQGAFDSVSFRNIVVLLVFSHICCKQYY